MRKSLDELQNILLQGQKLSMQGSLDRRMPCKNSVPFLLEARKGLKEFVEQNPNNALAWRALSQAEECLLNYADALRCLGKAIELSVKDKKDLKKIAALKEYESEWNALILTPEQLKELGNFLDVKLQDSTCDHTLRFTKDWLDENLPKSKKAAIIKSIQNHGGFCDCEVLLNIVD